MLAKTCPVCRIGFSVAPTHAHRVCCSMRCARDRRARNRLPLAVALERNRASKRRYAQAHRDSGLPCRLCGRSSPYVRLSDCGACSTTCASILQATKARA